MPKYIEIDPVESFNSRLDGSLSVGDVNLYIRIEPYSLKFTAADKKVLANLQRQGATPTAASNDATTDSVPLSPLAKVNKRPAPASPTPPQITRVRVPSLTAIMQSSPSHAVLASPSRKVNHEVRLQSLVNLSPTTHAAILDVTSSLPAPLCPEPSETPTNTQSTDLPVKTLTAFINSMNASYPDFDFSDSTSHSFRSISLVELRASLHTLIVHGLAEDDLENLLWQTVNAAFTTSSSKLTKSKATQTDPDSENCRTSTAYMSANVSLKSSHGPGTAVKTDRAADLTQLSPTEHSPTVPSISHALDFDPDLVKLNECQAYVFAPASECDDPLYEEGTIWSMTILFFHQKLKRLALMKIRSRNALVVESDDLSAEGTSSTANTPACLPLGSL